MSEDKAIALFPSARRVDLVQPAGAGELRPGLARVRTLRVGFCATDREMLEGGLADPPAGSEHIILGHELMGVVDEVGPGVTSIRAGHCVVAAIRRGCARCASCAVGRPDFCRSDAFMEHGIRRLHGFAQPQVDVEASALVKIDPALASFGFLAEPLSIVEKAMDQVEVLRQRIPGPAGTTPAAVIAGAGTVGLLATQLLVDRGYAVTVLDRRDEGSLNAELTRASGATYTRLDAADLWDWRPDRPFDVGLECSGSAAAAFGLMGHLAEGGGLVWIGMPLGGGTRPLPMDALVSASVLHQHAVIGTVNASAAHVSRAVVDLGRFAERGVVQRMVTSVMAPSEFAAALEGGPNEIKVAVEFAPIPAAVQVGAA